MHGIEYHIFTKDDTGNYQLYVIASIQKTQTRLENSKYFDENKDWFNNTANVEQFVKKIINEIDIELNEFEKKYLNFIKHSVNNIIDIGWYDVNYPD